MSYIGNEPTSVAFLTDTFSGNGSTTAFTLSAAPAGTSSILVAISGVVQDPSTYSVVGTTLTFSPAPPSGTSNISVRFLGIPASGVTTTAYRTVTEFTATAGQTTFNTPSYTPGFIDVYRNGVLLGSADYTASNGVSVVLASGATAGDLVEVISMQVSSVLNAIQNGSGTVSSTNLANGSVTMAKLDSIAQYTGFKNRIINGDMQIDQRNNGAAVTFPSGGLNVFTLDRWCGFKQLATGGSFTIARSSVAPAGFTNSALVTITSAATDTGTSVNAIAQFIEGLNISDLGWGTANAQTVTVSFWVRSSLTGTFSCSVNNDGYNYSYVANYTISAANTWEQKTITIPGPTAGTWLNTNGAGLRLWFDLGTGTGRNGTANTWVASEIYRTAGSVQLLANNGATWQVTGVQLERGTTATSFDVLDYGTELAMCQRYCVAYGGSNLYENVGYGFAYNTGTVDVITALPVQMRTAPSFSVVGSWQISDGAIASVIFVLSLAAAQFGSQQVALRATSSGLTQFRPYRIEAANSTAARIFFTAEL